MQSTTECAGQGAPAREVKAPEIFACRELPYMGTGKGTRFACGPFDSYKDAVRAVIVISRVLEELNYGFAGGGGDHWAMFSNKGKGKKEVEAWADDNNYVIIEVNDYSRR